MSGEINIENEGGGGIIFDASVFETHPVVQLSAGIEPDFFVVEVEALALRLTINPPSRFARFVLRRLGIVWSPFEDSSH